MKRISLLITILCFSFLSFSQTNLDSLTKEKVEALLSHKWQFIMMEVNGSKLPPFNNSKAFMIFKPNKVFTFLTGQDSDNANWDYNPINKIVSIKYKEERGGAPLRIVSLTSKELILLDESEGYFAKGDPNFPRKIYLKRAD